jgi:hypothetical protein
LKDDSVVSWLMRLKNMNGINQWRRVWIIAVVLAGGISTRGETAYASMPIRPPIQCPTTLPTLMPLLLRDLPSYANRVNQRAYTDFRTADLPGYMILADQPEYEPLGLKPGDAPPDAQEQPFQVFFTTLERQYVSGKPTSLQYYHRLFLVQVEAEWQLSMMFSTLGDYPADQPPTPPQDTSQGVIAQAIRLWLRDCQAGSVAGS